MNEYYNETEDVKFHNQAHGAEVMQSLFSFLFVGGANKKLQLTQTELVALLIASAGVDFNHTGTTNQFLVYYGHALATQFNETACLQNNAIGAILQVMAEERFNGLDPLSNSEQTIVRRMLIDCVLGTDLSATSDHLLRVQNMSAEEREKPTGTNRHSLVCLLFSLAS